MKGESRISYLHGDLLNFRSFRSIKQGICHESEIIHKTKTNPVQRIEHGTSGGSVFLLAKRRHLGRKGM